MHDSCSTPTPGKLQTFAMLDNSVLAVEFFLSFKFHAELEQNKYSIFPTGYLICPASFTISPQCSSC